MLTPLIWCIEKITNPLTAGSNSFTTDEAEIQLLAKMGQEAGTIEDDEFEMIRKIFDLNDMTAADLMTPRVGDDIPKRGLNACRSTRGYS